MRPCRWRGSSRRLPIGWPPYGPGVRRPRVSLGLVAPRPLGRSTSRQASGRETPNGEARCCVPRRRTRPIAGPYRRCPTRAGTAIGVFFMKRLVKLPTQLERANAFRSTPPVSARSPSTSQGVRARTSHNRTVSPSTFLLADGVSEATHPFIRAHRGTSGTGAREDPKEEQRPLEDGSHVRPDISARLLLQLDDLSETYADAPAASTVSTASSVVRLVRTRDGW